MSPEQIKAKLKRFGLKGVNKAKKTPTHPTKKGVVLAKEGNVVKLIRFGDQKMGHNYSPEARKSFSAIAPNLLDKDSPFGPIRSE